ncbi:MAG: flagellar hook-length control protein FliK [Spirochaetia bacterium]|nr:flagellar hook-length control protein FliK [Spirochaetia bacterium]
MQTRTVATVIDLVQRKAEKPPEKPETSFMSFLKTDLEVQEKASETSKKESKPSREEEKSERSEKKDEPTESTRKEKIDAAGAAASAAAIATARSVEERTQKETKNSKRVGEGTESPRNHVTSVETRPQIIKPTADLPLSNKEVKSFDSKEPRQAKNALFQTATREVVNSKKQEMQPQAFRAELLEGNFQDKKLPREPIDIKKQDIKTFLAQRTNQKRGSESNHINESTQASDSQSKVARERTVTIQVNPEKWVIQETAQRSFGEKSDNQSEKKSQGKDSKLGSENQNRVRMEMQRETVFAELLKPQLNPAEKEKLTQDTKHLFNQLVEKARINLGSDGQSSASLRLKPEQLGSVTLNLKVHGNVVEAKILVENDSVKKLVKDEMDQLQRELKRQGFSVDAIEIRVREPQMDSQTAFNSNLSARDDQAQRREHAARNQSFSNSFSVPVSPDTAVLEYEPAIEWSGSVNIAV